ncbi:hypothetical protein HDV04_004377 [Boothiomyces sp. JEL0838]|nr:hypothetical protein HDV04_004377 [Boothiomyces sp. JEL0838]
MLNIESPPCNSSEVSCEYFLKEYLKPFTNLDNYDPTKSVTENMDEFVATFLESATKLGDRFVENVLEIRDAIIEYNNFAIVDVFIESTGSRIWKSFQPVLDKPIDDIWNYYVDDSDYLMENGRAILTIGLLPKTRCKPTEFKPIEPKYDLHAQNGKLYEMIETEKNFVQCLEFLDFAYNEFLLNWKKAGLASQSIIKFTVIPVSNLLAAHKAYLNDLESATTPLVLCQIFQKHIKLIIPPTKEYTLAHDQLRYIKQDQLKHQKSEKNNTQMNSMEFRMFVAKIEQTWESKTGKCKYLGDELLKPTGRVIGYQNLFEALYKNSGNEKIFKDTYEVSVRSAKLLNHSLVLNHMENIMQQIHVKTHANFQFTYDGERITYLTDFAANELVLYKDRFISQPVKLLIFSKFIQVLKKGKSDFVNAGHLMLKDIHVCKTGEGIALIQDEKCLFIELEATKAKEFLGLVQHLKIKDANLKKQPSFVENEEHTIYYRLLHDRKMIENHDATIVLLEEEVDYTSIVESLNSNILIVVAVNSEGKFKLVKRANRQSPVNSISLNIPEEYEWKCFPEFKTDLVATLQNAKCIKSTSPKFTIPRDKEAVKNIVKQLMNNLVVKSQLPDSHARMKSTQSFRSLAPSTNSIQQLFHKFSIKRRNTSIATGNSKLAPSVSTSVSFRKEGRVGILKNIKTIFKKEISNFDVLKSITDILHTFITNRIREKPALPPSNQLIDETRVSQFINSIIKGKQVNITNFSSQFLVYSIITFFKTHRQLLFSNKDKRYMLNSVDSQMSDQEIIIVLKEYLLKHFTRMQLDLYETFFSQINELIIGAFDVGDMGMYLFAIEESDKETANVIFDNFLFHCRSMFKLPNSDDTKSVFSFIEKEEEQGRLVEYESLVVYQSVIFHTYDLQIPTLVDSGYIEITFEFNEKRQQLQIQEEDTLVDLVKLSTSSSLDIDFIDSMKAPQAMDEMIKSFSKPIEVTSDFFIKTISSINE